MKRLGLLGAGSPRALVVMIAIAGFGSACSLINKPDEIVVGSGGNDTGGGGSGAAGGAPPECTGNDECSALTTECATGECVDGACVATPQPSETTCGPEVGGSCDLQDMCDGNGNCVANNLPNGTYCEDCPAGAPDCALCNDGVCADCGDRATEKSFRAPLAASGWVLTGGWAVYDETPPWTVQRIECQDSLDNDFDGLSDDQDPGCIGPLDPFEQDFFIQPACSDGQDNDQDGSADATDPDCTSPDKDYEADVAPIVFERRVLGTDGNRRHPYGQFNSVEEEVSNATSPATVLPPSLVFRSWNLDEGYVYDLKAVQVSLDGSSFTTIARCENTGPGNLPFCVPSQTQYRAPDAWDTVTLGLGTCALNASLRCGIDEDCVSVGGACNNEFANKVGHVRFVHDSTDACCHWERGWYIDALNFAQDCACSDEADCEFVAGDCATASCTDDTSECVPVAQNAGSTCSLEGGSDGCIEPTCNDHGVCASNFLEFEADACSSCEAGDPNCAYCDAGSCLDCPATQGFDQCTVGALACGTSNQLSDQSEWALSGGWQFTTCLYPNSVNPSPTSLDCFPPQPMSGSIPHGAPVMGNDGVRIAANPYTFEARETAVGSFITSETVLPAQLTFSSWHQDRGGNDTFNLKDRKRIRASTNGGRSWVTILDCDANMTVAFCQPWTMTNTNRPLTQWDEISINVPANLVGETAIVEFSYDTVDSGQGWERGWFIDDLNILRCDYVNPPWFLTE